MSNTPVQIRPFSTSFRTFWRYNGSGKKKVQGSNWWILRIPSSVLKILQNKHKKYLNLFIWKIPEFLFRLRDRRTVLELMRELNISGARANIKRTHNLLGAAEKRINRLMQCFDVDSPNTVWVSDITSIDIKGRRMYICAYLDLYSRKVVAIRSGRGCSTNLALAALRNAINAEHPEAGLVIHTDNGGAFVSYSMRRLVGHYGFYQSFSRPGIPQDNSAMESFFNTLKQELLYRHEFRSEAEFKTKLTEYADYYNTERLHEYLGYKTPVEVASYCILESAMI